MSRESYIFSEILSYFDTLTAVASFNKIFFRGLITILPIAVTIYVIYSAVAILDHILGSLLEAILPRSIYFPGLGLMFILVLIYLFGLLLNNFVLRRTFISIEKKLLDIPFFKTIYSPLRDLMNLFSKTGQSQLGRVVLVQFGPFSGLGLITRESFEDLSLSGKELGKVAVYFPWSYGVGGMTLLVSRENITEIDIPVEKAMSLAITGWVKAPDAKINAEDTL